MSDQSIATPVVFIGGMGRSGSTLFELSLGTDPRVVALGEVMHLWQRSLIDDELCGCGVPFSQCEFWQAVGVDAYGGWGKVDAARMVYLKRSIDRTLRVPQLSLAIGPKHWLSAVREYADHYARLFHAAARVSNREVVVDSSKQASLPYVLRHGEGLDLKVVHYLRDSRAVAYSWTKKVRRPESRSAETSFMTSYPPGILALKWVQHNAVIEGLRLQGVPVLRLRYEDWVMDPVGTVQETLDFAGLESRLNASLNDDWVDLPLTHTCSGNPMRFTQGRVVIRRDDDWKDKLPLRSRIIVTGATSPALAAYGYLRSTSVGERR